MAQEVVLKVVATTAEAEENLKRLNETINEQNEILVDLERELYKVEEAQKNTSKANLAAQKKLTDQANHLKSAIKDQRISLKELNAERRTTKTALDSLTDAQVNQGKVIQGIDKVTGGYATKIKKLYLGLIEGAKGAKLFITSLSGIQKALLATGVGALVVALGAVVAYWDEIKAAINGTNLELEKTLKANKEREEKLNDQLTILKLQKENLELQGLSTSGINAEIRNVIQSQIESNALTIAALELEQERLKEKDKELSWWEKATYAVGDFMGVYGIGLRSIATDTTQSDKLKEISDQLQEAKENQLKYQNEIASIDAKARKKKEEADKKAAADQKKRDEEQRAYEEKVAADRLARLQKQIDEEYNLRLQGEQKIGALRRQFFLKNLDDSKESAILRSQFERERVLQEIEESKANDAQKAMAKAEVEKFFNNEELRINKEFEDKKTEQTRKAEEERAQIQQAKMDLTFSATSGILGALSELNSIYDKDNEKAAKRSFERNKKLQIAMTIVSTLQSAQQAYASQFLPIPTPDSPLRGSIAAGVALFAGYARVRAIEAQRYEAPQQAQPQTGGGRSITAPQAAPQFNIIGGSPQNQLAGLIADQSSQPLRAYVVSSEVSSGQALDRNIVESATLG